MSNRVNKIIFRKEKFENWGSLMNTVARQIDVLLQSGYQCFVTRPLSIDSDQDDVIIEYSETDTDLKDTSKAHACWLYIDELEYLSSYQLENLINETRETLTALTEELSDDIETSDSDEKYDA